MASTFTTPYDAGFDCGKNGPNPDNCNFGWFATREMTNEWERGKRASESREEPNGA